MVTLYVYTDAFAGLIYGVNISYSRVHGGHESNFFFVCVCVFFLQKISVPPVELVFAH